MQVAVVNKQIQTINADAVIVNLFEGVTAPGGATGAVDAALGSSDGVSGNGAISKLIQLGDFTGKLNEVAVVYTAGLIPAPRVIVAGLGTREQFTLDRARQASGSAVRKARDLGCRRVATIVHGSGIGGLQPREAAQATVEGALMGAYQFREHKSKNDDRVIEELIIVEYDAAKLAEIEAGVRAGQIVAEAVNAARTLVNRAPNALYPETFAQAAQAMAARVGLTCSVLSEADIAQERMGGVLAVAQGSAHPPRFVVLEHQPRTGNANLPTADSRPLVFIGKGVTFDTGGISIKPSENMQSMKADMSGAAAVFGAMQAIAGLNLPQRIIGVMPLVENMPSDRAYRPGDVITMMNGLTVEIISTDAEGRLILADALHYVKRFKPRGVVDLATLTGACVVALGEGVAAGLFSNDDAWANAVLCAAEAAGEKMWRLPLYPEYGDKIKSDDADIKNSGGRVGGVGTSAYFLYRFVEGPDEYPWAHVDMAGMMFSSENKGYLVKGAMGYGVRTLVRLAQAGT
ncbi:MAG: leucyl aminopeptidase [Candidatus Thermofonsia Clade 3 bacterium]|jgi:leucyl aminopeptidase|uniref:Probable cytosol aminopeptidase n=1 Tax=Candidatus Thermofonsia Clade 3 bacterium TaxID=2364212 RepID=A0A2M8QC20_9CHLR|nr:leucyl aminopeptidase [Candidatus Roseilinea sp. NK_OTU-006]PJF47346.1 MAG: leucyl aminopeptidase [Candidatus Thermofonsia Clade 3 bacterium]